MAEQEEERIMVVPLRKAWAASRTDRTPRAVKAIREHVKQHLKPDRIFIDDVLNEYLWKRGPSIRPAGSASRRSSSRTALPSSPSRRTEGPICFGGSRSRGTLTSAFSARRTTSC